MHRQAGESLNPMAGCCSCSSSVWRHSWS